MQINKGGNVQNTESFCDVVLQMEVFIK